MLYHTLMKAPESLTLIRHDESAFDDKRREWRKHPLFEAFIEAYNKNPASDEALRYAQEFKDWFDWDHGEHNIPLGESDGIHAEAMAGNLRDLIKFPDVIYVSPYDRTKLTLERMIKGWPQLADVRVISDEKIRERDHGELILFGDVRIFNVLKPDQMRLRKRYGSYWHRYPSGENIPDVRLRNQLWLDKLDRDHPEQNVLAVTHYLTILSTRANIEDLDDVEFQRLDHEADPINAGVTIYRVGEEDKLKLDVYNQKLY